jgi:carnosine N-methyltransferase
MPSLLPKHVNFSMAGGDFVQIYSEKDQLNSWDVIVTCFFLDTAHNVCEYVDVIKGALTMGGIWINLGPLQYHFEDHYAELSVEPDLELVLRIIESSGFKIQKSDMRETAYAQNPIAGLLKSNYSSCFFVANKWTN